MPKKGFGEKLKGVGKRIVQEAKKVPGTIYREGIKPEAKRILEKFTEVGPSATRKIKQEPQAGTTTAPFEEGPKGLRRPTAAERATGHAEDKAKRLAGGASRPAPKVPTIAEQIAQVSRPAPKDYGRAGGRTSSYKVGIGSKGAVARLEAERKASQRPELRRGTPQEKAIRDATKTTTATPLTDQTRTTPKGGRKKGKERGSISQYTIKTTAAVPKKEPAAEAIAKTPTPKKETRTDRTAAARKQRAGLKESRKGKAGKRKFSATKTYAELGKAASARTPIERIDTTSQEMARLITEQEVGREAERAEAALKGDRKPKREKARYRYQTRGYKRSEGRGR
jgi:hypothetical protein